jgi:hypothetical protein
MVTTRAASTSQPPTDGSALLPEPPSYPFLALMRDHGYAVAIAAGLGTFMAIARKGSLGATIGGVIAGASVAGSLAYVHEMTVVVTDTLLPE